MVRLQNRGSGREANVVRLSARGGKRLLRLSSGLRTSNMARGPEECRAPWPGVPGSELRRSGDGETGRDRAKEKRCPARTMSAKTSESTSRGALSHRGHICVKHRN